jgi:hypothetical protein
MALFSAAYFDPSRYTQEEWTSALLRVAGEQKDRLIPLRIEEVPAAQVARGHAQHGYQPV